MFAHWWLLLGMGGVLMAYAVVRYLRKPIRWLGRYLFRVALGGAVLAAWNLLGRHIGLPIGLNPWTAGAVGMLGAPGFVLVLALKVVTLGA